MAKENYAIWWLGQEEMESAPRGDGELEIPGPEYLARQWARRDGRPGGGRLWTDNDEFVGDEQKLGVDYWPNTPMSRALANCGGIVIRRKDLEHLATLPGLVTDFNLRRVA